MDSSKNTLPNEAYDDEISLRDLYLILKRNIFWIVSVPVLVAIVAFTLVSLMPPSYEAQSTTVVTPPPVEIDSDRGVRFQPAVSVPFESYERLALSNPVLTATLQELEELGEAPADLTLRGLSGMLDLEVLTGQSGAGTPLSVAHIVTTNDPELSATIANVWAQQTLGTVRDSLLDTLSPVNESTASEVAQLQRRLKQAEQSLEAFEAQNNLPLRRMRVEQLADRLTEGELLMDEIARRLTVSEARRDTLAQQLEEELNRMSSSDPTSDEYLAGMTIQEAAALLEVQRDSLRAEYDTVRSALLAFEEQYDLDLKESRINNHQREIAEGELQLDSLRDQLVVLRADRDLLAQQLEETRAGTGTSELSYDSWHLPPELALNDAILDVERQITNVVERSAVLEARLNALAADLPDLRRELLSLSFERDVLEQQVEVTQQALYEVENRLLSLRQGALDQQANQVIRDTTPEVTALQAMLREEEVAVRAARAELTALEEQLKLDEERLAINRSELAALETEHASLTRDRDNAQSAHDDVAQLEPIIAYMTQLTPTTARILNEASPPMEAVGPGRLLITVLAGLVTGMLTVLFVFLREAVRDPNATRGEERSGHAARVPA